MVRVSQRSPAFCFRCMSRSVASAGDLCSVCSAWDAKNARTGEDTAGMDLSQLAHTQRRGWTPENDSYWKHEVPFDPDTLTNLLDESQ